MLAKYDTSTYEYSSLCLGHAMANGFYTPRSPSDEAINLYLDYTTNKTLLEFGLKTNREVPKAYFKNEKYTLINLRDSLKSLSSKGIGIYAIYGKEDGLFSEKQVLKIKNLMGTDKVLYWETCAHSVFIDQQKLFLETMEKWLKK